MDRVRYSVKINPEHLEQSSRPDSFTFSPCKELLDWCDENLTAARKACFQRGRDEHGARGWFVALGSKKDVVLFKLRWG